MIVDTDTLLAAADPYSDTTLNANPTGNLEVCVQTRSPAPHSMRRLHITVKVPRDDCTTTDPVSSLHDTNHPYTPELHSLFEHIANEYSIIRSFGPSLTELEEVNTEDERYVFEQEIPIRY